MHTRKLGYTDLYLTAVGLGTADGGGGAAYGWAPRDDAESIATIQRAANPYFHEPLLSASLATVEELRAIAARYGRTVGQLAIAWVLRRPEVTAAIVGARCPAQIEETAPGGDWALASEGVAQVEALLAPLAAMRGGVS